MQRLSELRRDPWGIPTFKNGKRKRRQKEVKWGEESEKSKSYKPREKSIKKKVVSSAPSWVKRTQMEKSPLNMASGSFVDVQTQNKLGGRWHKGALGKSDWMSFFFLIKSKVESSAGSKTFPWQTLGRTGSSRMGTGKVEKLHHLPLCFIPLQIQFF